MARICASGRLIAALAVLATLGVIGPDGAGAQLRVTNANIEGGRLIVTGTAPAAGQQVTLDNRFTVRSSSQKTFTFSLSNYHSSDCIVDLSAGTARATAVVAFCGPRSVLASTSWKEEAEQSTFPADVQSRFVGPVGRITLRLGQRLFITGSVPIRLPDGFTGGVEIEYSVCIAEVPLPAEVAPGLWYSQTAVVTPLMTVLSASAVIDGRPAGTYAVGLCIRNPWDFELVRGRSNGWAFVLE